MAVAYLSMPMMIVYIVRKRTDVALRGIFFLFAGFLFLSGLRHLTAAMSLWQPLEWVDAGFNTATALASVIAAIFLKKMIPAALKVPSREHQNRVISQLEHEIVERKNAEDALRAAHDQLEWRVQERTAELYNRNQQLYAEIIEHNRVETALQDTQVILNSARRVALSSAGFDTQKISSDLLTLLAENHPFPTSAIFREDRRTGEFKCIAHHGLPQDGLSAFHFPDGFLAKIAREGRTARLACVDRTRQAEAPAPDATPLTEALVVPVMYQDECLTVLVVAGTREFGPAELAFMESLRQQLGVAQHNMRLYADSKRLASELNTRNIEIAQKNLQLQDISKHKSDFVANMSHELRTPLNAILGFTGTLLMRLPGPLTYDQDKQLRTIQTSARHLLSLINDLLDVEKIEAGKLDICLEPVVLQSVVREVFETLQPMAVQKQLEFKMNLPQANITIKTDRRALSQILLNLLNNAIKFTDTGSVTLRLSRRRTGDFGTVELVVSDTGIGICPQRQAQLFQAFTQLDASSTRRFDGSGLGLYLSQRLAVLVGGQLHCKSEYGRGSVFTLALPATKA